MLAPAAKLGFNLDFVVAVRSLLELDHQAGELWMNELVWPRTDALLAELAASRPSELRCLHERSTALVSGICHVSVVGASGIIIWLGEVIGETEARRVWELACEASAELDDPSTLELRQRAGPLAVCRDGYGSTISVPGGATDDASLAEGVRSYLQRFCPPLADLPVAWLAESLCEALAREMDYRIYGRRPRNARSS